MRVEYEGGVVDVRAGADRSSRARRARALLDAERGARYIASTSPRYQPQTAQQWRTPQ